MFYDIQNAIEAIQKVQAINVPPIENAENININLSLDELINASELSQVISSCSCMPDNLREDAVTVCTEIADKLHAETITIVSIGSGRLKQELKTAEGLMKKGKNVNFILVDPTYYMNAMNFPKINYEELKHSFDKIASELTRFYNRNCKIIAVFPSMYFFLKQLVESLELTEPRKPDFLSSTLAETKQFRLNYPAAPKFFFFNAKDPGSLESCDLIQTWRSNHAKDILIIQAQDNYFIAFNSNVNDDSSFFLHNVNNDRFARIFIEKHPHKIDFAKSYVPVEIPAIPAESPVFARDRLLRDSILGTVANRLSGSLVHNFLEDTFDKHPEKTVHIPVIEMLPHIVMAVDSGNKQDMHNTFFNIKTFFRYCYSKNYLFFEPILLHCEKDLTNKTIAINEDQRDQINCYVPPVILRQFSYYTHNENGENVKTQFPDRVQQIVTAYLNH